MTPRPPRRARLLVACAALVAGLALAGCSAHPGQVVVGSYTGLGGTDHAFSVSEARFAALTEEFAGTGVESADLLQMLIFAPAYIELGEKYGVTVSEEDARTILQGMDIRTGTYSDDAVLVARGYAIQSGLRRLGEQAQIGLATDTSAINSTLTVTYSPRYADAGSWVIQDRAAALDAG